MNGVDVPFIMFCFALFFMGYFGFMGYMLGWWI